MGNCLDSALKELGININQWPTLFALWEQDGLTQSELTSKCGTAHYTTTRILDSLEKLNLVERQPHPTSRRAHLVYLTEQGRKLETTAVTKAQSINSEFLDVLTAQEQEQLQALVWKLITTRMPELNKET